MVYRGDRDRSARANPAGGVTYPLQVSIDPMLPVTVKCRADETNIAPGRTAHAITAIRAKAAASARIHTVSPPEP